MIRAQSGEFARAAYNALCHWPARSLVEYARIVVTPEIIEFTASDSYTAGRDYCEVHSYDGEPPDFSALISRDALVAWDEIGRKDLRGKGLGALERLPRWDALSFDPEDSELTRSVHKTLTKDHPRGFELYEAVDEMIENYQPFRVAFQPQLIQRFAKTKTDKSERVLDLAIVSPDEPVLIKTGPTFKGLIMPVHREVHAEHIGDSEGLW